MTRYTFTPEQIALAHEQGRERRAERVRLWLHVSEAPEEIVAAFEKLAVHAIAPEVPRLVAGLREIASGLLAEGGSEAHRVYRAKARRLLEECET